MGVPRGGVEYRSAAAALAAYTTARRLWWAWHRIRAWMSYASKEWAKQPAEVAIVSADPDTITHFNTPAYDCSRHGDCRMVICIGGALSLYHDVFRPPPSPYTREVWLVNVASDAAVPGMENMIVRVLTTPDHVHAALAEIQTKVSEIYVYEGWNTDALVHLILENAYDVSGVEA
jgi:hypothetical protein